MVCMLCGALALWLWGAAVGDFMVQGGLALSDRCLWGHDLLSCHDRLRSARPLCSQAVFGLSFHAGLHVMRTAFIRM